jgi:hypothetical protein
MTPEPANSSECGCCSNTTHLTPVSIENRPGLSALSYRVGTHGLFTESMKASLSLAPGLSDLTTREDDDPAVALLDAWAMVCDVLTFYQERIANEAYLRTAMERRSILELAREIGYELSPGVAASTDLAFILDETRGAPGRAVIDVGTKVQSTPGQDEKPQVFETVERIEARAAWNRLHPRMTVLRYPTAAQTELYLRGISTGLKAGDALLMVSPDPKDPKHPQSWRFVILAGVEPDPAADRTRVAWHAGDDDSSSSPPPSGGEVPLRVYGLRLKTSLFGYNAPTYDRIQNSPPYYYRDPYSLAYYMVTGDPLFLENEPQPPISGNQIPLDGLFNQVVSNTWLVLKNPESNVVSPFFIQRSVDAIRTNRGVNSKVTQVEVVSSAEALKPFNVLSSTVYAQSEELQLAESPITDPVLIGPTISSITLDRTFEDLPVGRAVIVTGRRETLTLNVPTGGYPAGETFIFRDEYNIAGQGKIWVVVDGQGKEIGLRVTPDTFTIGLEEEEFCRRLVVDAIEPADGNHSILKLKDPAYSGATGAGAIRLALSSVAIYANVAHATHGESRNEVLGSGDAGRSFPTFPLKQSPLTYTSAPVPGGVRSSLEVRVQDYAWEERGSLFGLPPGEKAYATRLDDDGTVRVHFGSRLPTGTNNVLASYRTGIGLAGLVRPGQLDMLMTRPLGVKEVTNPLASSGAQDPESRDDARENAPLTVLTLERIVSLKDYEDFTRSFAGIGKAQAEWCWDGMRRIVFITVASPDGSGVDRSSDVYKSLVRSIDGARDTKFPVRIESYLPRTFTLRLKVRFKERYDRDIVRKRIVEVLKQSFSFERRRFGQSVTVSEILALVQRIDGVEAVLVTELNALSSTGPGVVPTTGSDTSATVAGSYRSLGPVEWIAETQPRYRTWSIDTGRAYRSDRMLGAAKARFVQRAAAPTIEPAELLTLTPNFGTDCIEEMIDEPMYC